MTKPVPYLRISKICELTGLSRWTVAAIRDGVREEIGRRYPANVIVDDLVNYYAWLDYRLYKTRLKDKNMRKTVPPFRKEDWEDVA